MIVGGWERTIRNTVVDPLAKPLTKKKPMLPYADDPTQFKAKCHDMESFLLNQIGFVACKNTARKNAFFSCRDLLNNKRLCRNESWLCVFIFAVV